MSAAHAPPAHSRHSSPVFHLELSPIHTPSHKPHSPCSGAIPSLAPLSLAANADDRTMLPPPSPTVSIMPSSPISPELGVFRSAFAEGDSLRLKRRSEASIHIFYAGAPVGLGLGPVDESEAEAPLEENSKARDEANPRGGNSCARSTRPFTAPDEVPSGDSSASGARTVDSHQSIARSRTSESTVRTSFSHSSSAPILPKTPVQRRPRTLEDEYREFSRARPLEPPKPAPASPRAVLSPRPAPRQAKVDLERAMFAPSACSSSASGYGESSRLHELKAVHSLDPVRERTLYLQIDQEGFREVLVRVQLRGEKGDQLEFVADGACHPFHSSALQGNPILRRVYVGEDDKDYLRRQASLSLREKEGLYWCGSFPATSGGPGGGKRPAERWSFVYEVLERRSIAQKKMKGERMLRPLVFMCSREFLEPHRGRKVSLASMAFKSLQPTVSSKLVHMPEKESLLRSNEYCKLAFTALRNDRLI